MTDLTETTILQIDGFTMRPLQFADLEPLAAIWADPQVTQFLPSQGVPITGEQTEKSLQSFVEHWQQRGYGIWAIAENSSSQMIGYCGLRYLEELGEVEVLYGLSQSYWGRGIATQAVQAAVSFGFNIARLKKLIAMALPENLASRRVIEKAGFQYEKQIHVFNLNALYYVAKPSRAFPGWYFDEAKMAGVDFHDTAQVEAYDRNQTASTPEKEQALVTRLRIAANHTVIDLGAGTANFAIQAALTGASVHAVDISAEMLTYAQNKAQTAGITAIAFHQAGFLSYDHQAELADFVVTKNALHILPDFWKMAALLRIAAMLKPEGVFYLRDVVFSFPPTTYETSVNEWIKRVAKSEGEGWTVKDFEMHVREENSTYGWIMEGMLTRAGFAIAEANYPTPTYAEYLCIKAAQESSSVQT
jgi:RimJ/RimL family protein N-acetyltransferase/ubiquinone/menaquinone biosynthesis C-methylase UbiE